MAETIHHLLPAPARDGIPDKLSGALGRGARHGPSIVGVLRQHAQRRGSAAIQPSAS